MNSVKILHAVRSAITAIAELLVSLAYCCLVFAAFLTVILQNAGISVIKQRKLSLQTVVVHTGAARIHRASTLRCYLSPENTNVAFSRSHLIGLLLSAAVRGRFLPSQPDCVVTHGHVSRCIGMLHRGALRPVNGRA